MYSKSDLEQWIKGCIEKDRSSQKRLYEVLASKMLVVCMRYSNSREQAEDILQDGFIKVFQNIHLYKAEGAFEGWVRRIMVNTALEDYRKNKHMMFKVDVEMAEDIRTGEEVFSSLNATELLKLIQKLPPGYKAVFNLYAIEGYSHAEVAEMLEISESTSKSQLSRARQALKEMVKKEQAKHAKP